MRLIALPLLLLATIGGVASRTCVVTDYGARGDGSTVNTKAIQQAIDACAANSASSPVAVVVPAGAPAAFVTGSLFLSHPNLRFVVEAGATLKAVVPDWRTNDSYVHFPLVYAPNTDGVQGLRHAALLNAGRCLRLSPSPGAFGDQCLQWTPTVTNLTLEGGGVIDGSGAAWWAGCGRSSPCPDGMRNDARPILMHLMHVDGLVVRNLSLRNSAFWNVVPQYARNVLVEDLDIFAPSDSPNTDGCDPQGCVNVLLQRLTIDNGDDSIAISAGKDLQGRILGYETRNVTVRDCVFRHGHGLSIGSGTAANVTDVLFTNITMIGTNAGPRIKSQRGRGGVVSNVVYENIVLVDTVTFGITVDLYYTHGIPPTNASATPACRDVLFRNISGTGVASAGRFVGLPESPLQNITLENVHISAKDGYTCQDANGSSSNSSPKPCL